MAAPASARSDLDPCAGNHKRPWVTLTCWSATSASKPFDLYYMSFLAPRGKQHRRRTFTCKRLLEAEFCARKVRCTASCFNDGYSVFVPILVCFVPVVFPFPGMVFSVPAGVLCSRRCFLLPLVGCFLWPPRCSLFPATPSRCFLFPAIL